VTKALLLASLYLGYGLVALTVIGWSVLVAALAPKRVLRARAAQARRPWLCLVLGFSQLLAVLLLMGASERVKLLGIAGLLGLIALFGQAIIGLAAFQSRLGQAVGQLAGRRLRPLGQLVAGGIVLALAGGFPYVGQVLLAMLALVGVGSVPLGRVVGEGQGRLSLPPRPG